MRLLLDESLPRKLVHEVRGHVAQTVQKQVWAGLKNGALLRKAATEFDVLLTGDQNLEFQQDTNALPIAVIVLVAINNRIETPQPLVAAVLDALQSIRPGQLIRIGAQPAPQTGAG